MLGLSSALCCVVLCLLVLCWAGLAAWTLSVVSWRCQSGIALSQQLMWYHRGSVRVRWLVAGAAALLPLTFVCILANAEDSYQ